MTKRKKILFIILYWIMQLTWGSLMTLVGLVVGLFAIILFRGKVSRNGCTIIIEVFENWGGVDLGAITLCAHYSDRYPMTFTFTRKHEFGHSLQNIILGPFFLFVVAIPSVFRYWFSKKDYYAVWFERTASSWGIKIVDLLEGENK